jgi:HlyD family secretion protein
LLRIDMKKTIGWIVAVAIFASIGFAAWRYQKAHAAPDIVWKTSPAETRKISAKVTASGTLQATVTVQIGAQVSGRIQKLNADFNTTVKKGQLLAKLDPQLFQASVEQANANFMAAKASVAKAEAQEKDAQLVLARTKSLAEGSLASAADLQTAQTNIAVAKAATEVEQASLAQASASLHQAQVNLSYTDIYSPINGTVISRAVDVGQTVAASLQAPVLFTIAEDLRTMQVHTSVAEGDVGRLQQAMDATFTVDAFPGQTFRGKVGQIRNAPQTVQNVVTYDAVIDVDNADLRLRPGMTATVTIVYAERDDALVVANSALRFRLPPEVASAVASGDASARSGSAGSAETGSPAASTAPRRGRAGGAARAGAHGSGGDDRRTVYVMRGSTPSALRVTTGLSDGTVTEIVKGEVKPGDEVVVDVAIAGKAGGAPTGPTGGAPRIGRMF